METSLPTRLPGADSFYHALQAKQERPRTSAERLIDRANSEVSIFDVLEHFFDIRVPREGRSWKAYCPFAYEHGTNRADKGWRTYPDSNSSMCFIMHGYMGPVRLISLKYSERQVKAAERLLKYFGHLEELPWKDRFAQMQAESENQGPSIGNPQHAVAALDAALKDHPQYVRRQFDTDVMKAMEVVLDRLDEVVRDGDPEKVREWYGQAKLVMHRVIEGGLPR